MASLRFLILASRDWYHPATTGGDNTLWENARYLASVGHRVTFLTSRFPGARREETIDGIRVVRIGSLYSLWLRTFVYYMKNCRGRYDVVITEGFGGSRIPRLAPLYVKEPIVTAWHQIHTDLFAAQYPRSLLGPLSLFERATAWIHRDTFVQAYTSEWKEAFPTIGFKPDRVFVVPVSIRDDWLNTPPVHLGRDATILWIGKFRRYKCPDHVVRALPRVRESVPGARLVLAGRHDDRRYEAYLEQLVSDFDLRDAVEFRFNVSEKEKKDLLSAARLVVLPSAVEGFGIVVLEANSFGVPVVASSRVPESAVTNGLNGTRYPFGDISSLSRELVRLLSEPEYYSTLSQASISWVHQFAWSRVGADFERNVVRLAMGVG